jgi:hypothetical protein
MNRYAPFVLTSAFIFLDPVWVSAKPPKAAAKPDAVAASQAAAAAAQHQHQEDAARTRREVEQLHTAQMRDAQEIAKVIRNQVRAGAKLHRIERDAWLVLGLLSVAALLAGGALGLGWRDRKSVSALEEKMREDLRERLEELQRVIESGLAAAKHDSAAKGSGAGQDKVTGGDLRPVVGTAAGGPAFPSSPPRQEGPAPPKPGTAKEAPPPVPPGTRHPEVASLLAKLRRDAGRLAERFADPDLRERFQGEFDAPLGARLDRLRTVSEQGEDQLRERWLGPDLVTTLDALARFYSEAVEEERRGHGTGLARDLRSWLYDSFGPACRSEGWFAIDPIDPYTTEFDPRAHHAVAGRDVDGAEGRIIAIKSIGRRDPRTGVVMYKAEVIVGR